MKIRSIVFVVSVETNSGIKFEANTDETLLEAAQAAGINIPSSCKLGRCSTCKVKLLSGKTIPIGTETGLTAGELSEGWILSCIHQVVSSSTIQTGELLTTRLPPERTLPCKISNIERRLDGILIVRLQLPPKTKLQIFAGQFLDIIIPGGERRSYSLASIIREDNTFDIHVKAIPNGILSYYWFNVAKEGDLLRINGPRGSFFLRRGSAHKDVIFLATGTGVAPVNAILQSIATDSRCADNKPNSISLYWGMRRRDQFYWAAPKSEQIAGIPFHYVPVVSREKSFRGGKLGYVYDALLADKSDFSNCNVYACGSSRMISDAHTKLTKAGLPPNHFYSDAFVDSSPK